MPRRTNRERREEKKWKPFFRKWNFQSLSSIVRGVSFAVIYPLCHISPRAVRFEVNLGCKKSLQKVGCGCCCGLWPCVESTRGRCGLLTHNIDSLAWQRILLSDLITMIDGRNSLVSFSMREPTTFCEKLAGKIGFVVVWLWRIKVRVESRWCHGDFSLVTYLTSKFLMPRRF